MQVIHRNEGSNDSNRQADDRNQRRSEVEQEPQADYADNERFQQQVALQSVDRFLNQRGAVVGRNYLNSRGQRWLNFGELLLDPIDDVERVQPIAHDNNPAYGLSFSLPFRNAFANIGTEGNTSHVSQQDRSAILCCEGNVLQVGK